MQNIQLIYKVNKYEGDGLAQNHQTFEVAQINEEQLKIIHDF
jgi:hypothetical protein